MTVRHVEHGAPSLRLALPLALLGPAFFLSSYLLSVGWDVPSGCRAAVVGLAATVTAWLASAEWLAVHRPGPRSGADLSAALFAAVLPCAGLAAVSVALLRRGDSSGVWAVIPVVALVQAGALLRSGRLVPDPEPDGAAPAAGPGGPETVPGVPVPDPTPAGGPEDPGRERPPAGENPTSCTDEDGPAPHKDGETEQAARPPEVGIDAELWRNLAEVLAEPAERRQEQGGVALTARTDDGMWTIVGAVLPQQTWANAVRCEFSVLEVERVRDALDSLGPDHRDAVRITWLHTHPGLSVFLSSTDHDTSAKWRALDPDFRPVVVDVTKDELGDRVGVFDARGEALRIGLVDRVLPAGTAGAIRDAVLERYRRTGGPAPLVLVGAEPYRT
ncbi:hypothetical protein [Streptomyces sp. NPDC046988]|uniref:hypothetical protein n=1 Tax=Streptomyces sp. NPDC046988 TaxID=3154922 RepID=UPI0033E0E029